MLIVKLQSSSRAADTARAYSAMAELNGSVPAGTSLALCQDRLAGPKAWQAIKSPALVATHCKATYKPSW